MTVVVPPGPAAATSTPPSAGPAARDVFTDTPFRATKAGRRSGAYAGASPVPGVTPVAPRLFPGVMGPPHRFPVAYGFDSRALMRSVASADAFFTPATVSSK